MKRKRVFSAARALLQLTCIVLGLILAAMVGFTAIFQYLLGQIQYSQPDAAPLLSQKAPDPGTQLLEFLDPGDVNWTQLSADLTQKERSIVNILLVGQDRREGERHTRADSILLCTFDKSSHTLTMTSFLRDLYVPIPGHGSDRINSAYAYGGLSLLKETLAENFDVAIHGAVEVDFTQFASVIDTLGGVRMQLRQDEAELINRETGSSLSEGEQLLTGTQALAYSRIRSLDRDGDFSRTDRQRKLMAAVVDSYKDAELTAIVHVLRQILPLISTDLSEPRILMLGLELFPILQDVRISSRHIPAEGTFTDKTINGMAVLEADMDAARQLLREITGGA